MWKHVDQLGNAGTLDYALNVAVRDICNTLHWLYCSGNVMAKRKWVESFPSDISGEEKSVVKPAIGSDLYRIFLHRQKLCVSLFNIA